MKKFLLIICLIFFIVEGNAALLTEGDKKSEDPERAAPSADNSSYAVGETRFFPELDQPYDELAELDPIIAEDFIGTLNDTLSYHHQRALKLDEQIKSFNKFVEVLDEKTLADMPIGLKREIGGLTYSISLDSIVMTPEGAYLIAYMVFEEPGGKKLTFRGNNIQLSKTGGLTGQARLELIGDRPINLFGNKSRMILKGDGSTYVEFDCNGFKSLTIGGEIEFSRDLFVPETIYGNVKEGRVTASFTTSIANWNDLIAEISIPSFQIKGLEGFGFRVKNAVFDYSDYRNAPALRFPRGYFRQAIPEGARELWRGLYIREFLVSLPKQFNSKGSRKRKKFNASDVIIDHMGFTGDLKVLNLIETGEGDMNGWAYSLDEIAIEIQANQLKSGKMKGEIVIPISDQERAFEYSAIINPDNEYIFNVEASDSLQFDVFKTSKVDIFPSSFIEVTVQDDKFLPKATLHGNMNITADLGKKEVNLVDITFEDLEIQSVKPYVKVGYFSFGSEAAQQKMADFPISINEIGLKNPSDKEMALYFDLRVNVTGSDAGGFSGESGLSIFGELPDPDDQEWKYKDLNVRDIKLDIDGGVFEVKGQLAFYKNDAVYGDGFSGYVDATFTFGLEAKATAIFGNVDGFRYWYVDALASFSGGTPIFTGVGAYGFGGGAYYRMAMDTEGTGSELGETVSGIVYVPKKEAGLGLKATLEIGSYPKPEAFNGDVTLEVAFFRGGGVRYISLKGNGYMATPVENGSLAKIKEKTQKLAKSVAVFAKTTGEAIPLLAENSKEDNSTTEIYGSIGESAGKKGQISAHVFISYDFENRVLHGNFEAYVNVAGGIIRGVGAGGRAGWAVLHFAPDDWYVYVGTPDDRIGLSVGIGPVRAEATSYLMVGTKIPGSPPPPAIVSEILGGIDLDYMKDENALGKGQGLGFGAALSMDTGDLTFLAFYARFQAGLGFDIMLKNYGESVRCKGRSEPLGVNGWYANGQAYAYFDGEIGIKVKLFGRRKKVEILSLAAAAVLQAKLPNPFWMRGIVGGRYSVLGGLVKGDCRFEVTLGEECEIVGGSVVEGIQVIADVTPESGEREVNVFTAPQAVFNMPVMEEFEMVDVDDVKKKFRIKLDHFRLVHNGTLIPGSIEWNEDNMVAAYNSFDVFPSEKEIEVQVRVSFQEYTGGSWKPVLVDGKVYTEEFNGKFKSGVAPDYIPHQNVAYSYPVINQYNYHPKESDKGYIKLKKGQPYLFDVGSEWKQVGRFTAKGGGKTDFDFTYNSRAREVNYQLPSNLIPNQIYAFELINTPAEENGKIDRNIIASTEKVNIGGATLNTEVTTRSAEGTIENLQEKPLYTAYLRTSRYVTFADKVDAVTDSYGWRRTIRNGIHELGRTIYSAEYYDVAEIEGVKGQEPLLQFRAVLNDNYYKNYIHPLNYENYPLDGNITITQRDPQVLGVPPVRAVYIRQNPGPNPMLTDEHIANGRVSNFVISAAFIYNLPHYYERDYMNLQSQVANRYIDGSSDSRLNYLLTTPFPRIRYGYYDVQLQYVLPGKNKVVSEKLFKFSNSVPD